MELTLQEQLKKVEKELYNIGYNLKKSHVAKQLLTVVHKESPVSDLTDSEKSKVGQVMSEFKNGELKDSSGAVVTDRKQAIAIALSKVKEKRSD